MHRSSGVAHECLFTSCSPKSACLDHISARVSASVCLLEKKFSLTFVGMDLRNSDWAVMRVFEVLVLVLYLFFGFLFFGGILQMGCCR